MDKTGNHRKRILDWAIALGFVAAWYGILTGISAWLFHVSLYRGAIFQDLLANLLLGALIYAISRSLAWFVPGWLPCI